MSNTFAFAKEIGMIQLRDQGLSEVGLKLGFNHSDSTLVLHQSLSKRLN